MKPKKMKVKYRQQHQQQQQEQQQRWRPQPGHCQTHRAASSTINSASLLFCNVEFRLITIMIVVLCLFTVSEVCAHLNHTDSVQRDRPLVNRYDYDYGDSDGGGPAARNRTDAGQRNGKFLFDALFGIEQSFEYDEVSDDDKIKTCSCGKFECAIDWPAKSGRFFFSQIYRCYQNFKRK